MKILLLILLSILPFRIDADYPRFKRRGFVGPPAPPRPPPPPPQFVKKWHQPQFMQKPQNLPRRPPMFQKKPFNFQKLGHPTTQKVHGFQKMPPNFKIPINVKTPIPMGQPLQPTRPVAAAPPARFLWQNQNQIQENSIQFPKETLRQIPKFKIEKAPFKTSPTLPVPVDYDFHIQTNSIPTNAAPIQQYGEKGPIHTIPAPNLSPADKPSDLRLNKPIVESQPQFQNVGQISDQYEVTESSEHMPKTYFRDQVTHTSDMAQTYQNIQDFYNEENQKNLQRDFYNQENQKDLQQDFYNQENQKHLQQTVTFEDDSQSQASHQENNAYDSQNSQLYTQAIQSTFNQQRPQLSTIQFVQDEAIYGKRSDTEDLDAEASDTSINVQPLDHNSTPNAGFVTATYTLKDDSEDTSQVKVGSKSNVDSIMQSEIVNSYFDTRTESNKENDLEPDAKSTVKTKSHEELISSYYSSLPNQETAERLAKLQKAGKINSSLMKISSEIGKNPISIYVPDDTVKSDEETMIMEESEKLDRQKYEEDYSQEYQEASSEEMEGNFGSKLNPNKFKLKH